MDGIRDFGGVSLRFILSFDLASEYEARWAEGGALRSEVIEIRRGYHPFITRADYRPTVAALVGTVRLRSHLHSYPPSCVVAAASAAARLPVVGARFSPWFGVEYSGPPPLAPVQVGSGDLSAFYAPGVLLVEQHEKAALERGMGCGSGVGGVALDGGSYGAALPDLGSGDGGGASAAASGAGRCWGCGVIAPLSGVLLAPEPGRWAWLWSVPSSPRERFALAYRLGRADPPGLYLSERAADLRGRLPLDVLRAADGARDAWLLLGAVGNERGRLPGHYARLLAGRRWAESLFSGAGLPLSSSARSAIHGPML